MAIRVERTKPVNFGTGMGRERFNAVDFFPDQPDEMGMWPKGVLPPCRYWGKLISVSSRRMSAVFMPVTLAAGGQKSQENQYVRSFWWGQVAALSLK